MICTTTILSRFISLRASNLWCVMHFAHKLLLQDDGQYWVRGKSDVLSFAILMRNVRAGKSQKEFEFLHKIKYLLEDKKICNVPLLVCVKDLQRNTWSKASQVNVNKVYLTSGVRIPVATLLLNFYYIAETFTFNNSADKASKTLLTGFVCCCFSMKSHVKPTCSTADEAGM